MPEEEDFHELGESISREKVVNPEIKALLAAQAKNPFVDFVDIRRNDSDEALVLDFKVELPQEPPVPIHHMERIAISVPAEDGQPPAILALRRDFPETLHQNLVAKGGPRSLCLFEESYAETSLGMTPENLLQRIAEWLTRAAREELHLDDQPLEPLLITPNRIIFDTGIFDLKKDVLDEIVIQEFSSNPLILRAVWIKDYPNAPREKSHIVLRINAAPWHSDRIEYSPINLADLVLLFSKLDLDLEKTLRAFVETCWNQQRLNPLLTKHIILLLRVSKTRKENGPSEGSPEYWAFMVLCTLEVLATYLGTMGRQDGKLVPLLGSTGSASLDTISVLPLRPALSMNRELAQVLSGIPHTDETKSEITVIGVGALGSETVLNLARQGFGKWNIVDIDHVLPHNLSRHALTWFSEGANKAIALSFEINHLLNSDDAATPYVIDVLKLRDGKSDLWQALSRSKFILDLSASHAVSRFLTHASFGGRLICMFISPSGNHLVVLAQDANGKLINLEDLNYQLATAVHDIPGLSSLYSAAPGLTLQSGSCRDQSVVLSQDTVGVFAGIASKLIKSLLNQNKPMIEVWEIDNAGLAVEHHKVPVSGVKAYKRNGWTVRISSQVNLEIKQYRAQKLPNETGGVLVGAFDVPNRTIYICKALPSPDDSVEWPTSYIRGIRGLRVQVAKIESVSGNELHYVGEWHSHPRGYGSHPSELDLSAHKFLAEQMGIDGLPGLMLIKADHHDPHILLASN